MSAARELPAIMAIDEIVPGGTVRIIFIDGKQYMSIRDLIAHMCGINFDHAGKTWRRMSDEHKSELQEFCAVFQFPGRGNSNHPVITFPGAIKLTMFLTGKAAAFRRSIMAKIISRYITGDLSLNQEIMDNKDIGESQSYLKLMHAVEQDVKRKHNEIMEEIPATSYIYATHSVAFPGLVKIGRSRNVKARLSSGNTFTAPAPHILIAMAPTFDAVRDEKRAHDYFNFFRDEGEFFKISHDEAIKYLSTVIKAHHDQELEEFSSGVKGSLVFV